MKAAGLEIKKHVLDNECSMAMKSFIQGSGIKYELVPPGQHRRNQAERAIQTFKSHFISILAGVDDKFPLSLWYHLLKPAELTLNILRQSRVTPNVSAFAHVHGNHNYMRKPFTPIGCTIQTHIKPNDRLSWDTRSEPGFNLGTSMEHHRCFRVYVTRTRATRISETVFFKHQYITNPTLTPEYRVVAAAQQLATALKGNIPAGNETAEALTKVSKLFTKIAAAKQAAAAAKEQQNRLRANPAARITTHLPRVDAPPPRVDVPFPRVAETPQADCCVVQIVAYPTMPRPVDQAPATRSHSRSPRVNAQSSAAWPNYISQDKKDDYDPPPQRWTTRSTTRSIMQEAMFVCIDIYKPEYILSEDLRLLNYATTPTNPMKNIKVTPSQMSMRRIPMMWFCEMANAVIGEGGELLEYKQLIAIPKMQATWTHSYGNEIGQLAQGMPGRNTGTNTLNSSTRTRYPKSERRT